MSTVLVFDSGLGGLTVLSEIIALRPNDAYVYVADNAAFPYGNWKERALRDHVVVLAGTLIAEHAPDVVVIACNTVSTLVLPELRRIHRIPFVGTVPAIKPAAERTRSGLISVLATPGTVKRDYTKALISDFARQYHVTLVGAPRLAALAEAKLAGAEIAPDTIRSQIQAAFVEEQERRTDQIVLACTHYPWLLDEFRHVAPWPVEFVNPAPAIARRAVQLMGTAPDSRDTAGIMRFTDPANAGSKCGDIALRFQLKRA